MKYILTLLVLVTVTLNAHAQFPDTEKKKCYKKYGPDGKELTREQQRYAEWECGKLAGVVDCNTELTYDEATNTVFREVTDFSNVAGANKPFNGTCESCYMNGVMQHKVTFVNGKENGVDSTYYRSGCVQVVRSHVMGVEHGSWYHLYDSTQYYAWEMNYNMGEKHGKQIYFAAPRSIGDDRYQQDTIKWENYNQGILDGVKKTYYKRMPDGTGGGLKREVTYKMGIMDGPFKIYNTDRVVIQEINYKEGKKDKEATYYYDDGKLLKTENWDMGVKNGEFKTFFYQGHIQTSENYRKGKKEGWFEEFYPDQTTKRRRLFKKDELIEERRYDEHGRETYRFGGTDSDSGAEDDELPETKKKKKKR